MYEVTNVAVNYGAAAAVSDVNLRIDAGELVVVVGPNGAGKSTLINAMAGLHAVASGRLAVDGHDITRESPHRFCDHGIAIVPEGRRLFVNLTVRENLELGSYRAEARRTRAESLRRVSALFPVLAERMDVPAGALSGGQQQMVAIGRALMARPRFLLLDEPSLGLSPMVAHEMFRAIREVNAEGVAVLLVEQNVAMALELARRAYVLDEGRIAAEGEPRQLMSQPQIQRAYLGT
ncbi:MAG: branched-chain amino acid transport system ATP-binding protein [Betaproteobacteria bacterium]|jgi:branched-chain amino acid transport system ATP-binding protein|nr:branched-chain amino acid transport system ATP-binding protein [Betaproteobacteria bacterium]